MSRNKRGSAAAGSAAGGGAAAASSIIRSENMAPLSAAVDYHVTAGLDGCPTAKVHMPACLSAAVNAMSFSVARYGRWPAPTRGITAAMIMLMVAKMLSAPTLVLE